MNDTPPCPNATPEWAVKAAEAVVPLCSQRPPYEMLDVSQRHKLVQEAAIKIAHHAPTAPLPTVAPHYAGLVERLEEAKKLMALCLVNPKYLDAITDAISALTEGAREHAKVWEKLDRACRWNEELGAKNKTLQADLTDLRQKLAASEREVLNLKNALDMGQANCDAVYEDLREERDEARRKMERFKDDAESHHRMCDRLWLALGSDKEGGYSTPCDVQVVNQLAAAKLEIAALEAKLSEGSQ